MPKRTDIDTVLIIGAGPIVIGQACEFDYSGAQACKALREEGYRVVLVNSNPATIMTDPETADAVYIEPVHWRTVATIIEKERPDALLPTMGGQTGLNCALDLAREGVLEKFGVELIGASREAIDMAEDREQFREAMTEIGLESARSDIAHNMEDALAIQKTLGFPIVIRPSFTLEKIQTHPRTPEANHSLSYGQSSLFLSLFYAADLAVRFRPSQSRLALSRSTLESQLSLELLDDSSRNLKALKTILSQ